MRKLSAGLLVYRMAGSHVVEVLLVHPGGPYWAKKDDGSWSLPKGEYEEADDPAEAADREFAEELGKPAPEGVRLELGALDQPSGKRITAWAVEGDLDTTSITSNLFEMEWPPKSGTLQAFPEVDRAGWFPLPDARAKLLKGQVEFLDRLMALLVAQRGPRGGPDGGG